MMADALGIQGGPAMQRPAPAGDVASHIQPPVMLQDPAPAAAAVLRLHAPKGYTAATAAWQQWCRHPSGLPVIAPRSRAFSAPYGATAGRARRSLRPPLSARAADETAGPVTLSLIASLETARRALLDQPCLSSDIGLNTYEHDLPGHSLGWLRHTALAALALDVPETVHPLFQRTKLEFSRRGPQPVEAEMPALRRPSCFATTIIASW